MSIKEIKSILLTENEDNYLKIFELLDLDFKNTIQVVFDILYFSISRENFDDVNLMLDNIEKIITNLDKSKLKNINRLVKTLLFKIVHLKDNNDNIKYIEKRLMDMNKSLNLSLQEKPFAKTYGNLYNVIFEKRDLNIIELLLSGILINDIKKDIFYEIINYYIMIPIYKMDEINYFRDVIFLFFKYRKEKITKNIKLYVNLIKDKQKFCNIINAREILDYLKEIDSEDLVLLKKKYDIQSRVHNNILNEMASFSLNQNGRKVINADFITIDNEDAICLDDALSLQKNADGSYYFYVAISDIPSIVPFKSLTFYDAIRKMETMYLCDDMIDLYDSSVMSNLSYLYPDVYRNVIVYRYFVSPSLELDENSLTIIKGIIKVSNKLSFSDVNNGENMTYSETKMLDGMAEISEYLKGSNDRKEYREIENTLYPDAIHHHSLFTANHISAGIVEESMLLVGHTTAKYFKDRGLNYIFRNHAYPKVMNIREEMRKLLSLEQNDPLYMETFEKIKELYLNAYYSLENKGHEGLGYKDGFSHSTSPLRRAPDGINQYCTYLQVFENIGDKEYEELHQMLNEFVNHFNIRKKQNEDFTDEYNTLVRKLIKKNKLN